MRISGSIRLLATLCALAVAPTGLPSAAAAGESRPLEDDCEQHWPNVHPGVTIETITVATGPEGDLEETSVYGCLAYPSAVAAEAVDTLVVAAHGNGHTVQKAWAHHLAEMASHGVAAISVNFRDNFGFPVMRGAEDTIVATLVAKARFPAVERTLLIGVSMGGAISGTAITQAPRFNDGKGLYDYWFVMEGVSDLVETWTEASLAESAAGVSGAAAGIERDAGGTPADVPEAYRARSPVMNAPAMAALGLRGAVLTHSIFDGLVPYWQGRTMADALRTAGVPTEFTTVARGGREFDDSDPLDLAKQGHLNDESIGLAGHASEKNRRHPVIAVALERLFTLIAGTEIANDESIVDE